MVRCPLHPQAAPKKITIKIGMYNNPKTQGREAKKMPGANATALVFDPINLTPKTPPFGLISDLGYCIFINILINTHLSISGNRSLNSFCHLEMVAWFKSNASAVSFCVYPSALNASAATRLLKFARPLALPPFAPLAFCRAINLASASASRAHTHLATLLPIALTSLTERGLSNSLQLCAWA